MERPFRVLSLDGGGAWSVVTVKALIALYSPSTLGHDVLRDFDVVAGTSGGAIVASGLLKNVPLSRLLELYLDNSQLRAVFQPSDVRGYAMLNRVASVAPKYSTQKKYQAIVRFLDDTSDGTAALGSVALEGLPALVNRAGRPVSFVIPAMDYDRQRATFFRAGPAPAAATMGWGAPPASTVGGDAGCTSPAAESRLVTLAEAVHASSTAPVLYYDEPARVRGRRYWDGGVAGFNNPVLAGVTELVGAGVPAERIAVLSIGTGSKVLPLPPRGATGPQPPFFEQRVRQGLIEDITKMGMAILDDPPDSALSHACMWIQPTPPAATAAVAAQGGEPLALVRLSPLLQPVWDADAQTFAIDGDFLPAFLQLLDVGLDAIQPAQMDNLVEFADRWIRSDRVVPNQPIVATTITLEAWIGHRWFADGAEAWRAMGPIH